MPPLAGINATGNVYYNDGTQWVHIPDVATFNADGFDWDAIQWADGLPDGSGDPAASGQGAEQASVTALPMTPAAPPPPSTPAATPAVTEFTTRQTATAQAPPDTFQWGGKTWGAGDLAAFVSYLDSTGADYSAWAENHPSAAAILTSGETEAEILAVPKSVGEAIALPSEAGATPAEAAAIAAPLAAAQAAQGFGAPTPAELPAAAAVVAAAVAAEPPPGSVAAQEPPAPVNAPPSGPEGPVGAPTPPAPLPSGTFTHAQLEAVWQLAGGSADTADVAAAIAQAESGGNPSSVDNSEYPGKPGYHTPSAGAQPEFSIGLWQINLLAHPTYTESDILQPLPNAHAAVAVSNGGTDFEPWSTYTNGAYKAFLGGGVTVTAPAGPEGPIGVAQPAGVNAAWGDLIGLATTGVPKQSNAVESLSDSLIEVFK